VPHGAGSGPSGPDHGRRSGWRDAPGGAARSAAPPTPAPTLLGFDEKVIRKGHRYATILTDVENGCVIDLVEERTKEAALHLLGQLPEGSAGSVLAVAMDMWPAYIGAVE
jgi:transposase